MNFTLSGIVSILALGVIGTNAWCIAIFDDENFTGNSEQYASSETETCYPLVNAPPSEVPPNVHSVYSSGPEHQFIQFFDNVDCGGKPAHILSMGDFDQNITYVDGSGKRFGGVRILGNNSLIPEDNICTCPDGFDCSN